MIVSACIRSRHEWLNFHVGLLYRHFLLRNLRSHKTEMFSLRDTRELE